MTLEASNTSPMPPIWLMQALPDFISDMTYFPQDCRTEYALTGGNFSGSTRPDASLTVLQSLLFSRAGSESKILDLVVPANGKEGASFQRRAASSVSYANCLQELEEALQRFKKAAIGSVVHRSIPSASFFSLPTRKYILLIGCPPSR